MFKVEIKFEVESKKEIRKTLNEIKKQIKDGEIEFSDKGEKIKDGYLMNKFNNINIQTEEGYSIGQFKVIDSSAFY